MRIGAHVYRYDSAEQWAVRHTENGYGATYFPLNYKDDPEKIDEYVDAAQRHGLIISEVGAWNNQLERDLDLRMQNFRDAVGQLKLADHIGAYCCVNIAGSLGETWDGPHPDNLSEENFLRVVSITQQIIDAAQPKNSFYTLEPMPWMFPHTIEDLSRLINKVNREMFAVHVDMCNMINNIDHIFNSGALVREFFSEFAPLIRSVHAKDTVIDKRLTLHINEVVPGKGIFDYDALFCECAKLDPNLPVMAEHLDTEAEYIEATRYMQNKASSLNITLVKGY